MKLRTLAFSLIALSGVIAPAAMAQPWPARGGVVIEYGQRDWGRGWDRGGNVGDLYRRQSNIAEDIRAGERYGWLDRYEARRAWEMLDRIRERTDRAEYRFGRRLPEREERNIRADMNQLDRFIDREARDRRWRR
jgi:hypothetical protein